MTIFLRSDVVSDVVSQKFKAGKDGLAVAWSEAVERHPEVPQSKNRSAIYRWIQKGVPSKGPKKAPQIFIFCSILDVDPLSVADFRRIGYFDKFTYLRRLIQLGPSGLGGLAPLLDLYGPNEHWPSDAIAQKFFGRPWCCHQFENTEQWESTDYALVKCKFSSPSLGDPRAVHIAYRRYDSDDRMWRFYGTVLAINGELELYNEGGIHLKMPQVEEDEIRFRTYFGGRPVEFRVASLHEFSYDIECPFNDMDTIGFNW